MFPILLRMENTLQLAPSPLRSPDRRVTLGTRLSDGKDYSIKQISKFKFGKTKQLQQEFAEELKAEISILRSLSHPNIIKLHEVYENDQFLYLVTDLCKGGELFARIKALSEAESSYSEEDARQILKQLMQALEYLHSKKIAHCDLKVLFYFLCLCSSPRRSCRSCCFFKLLLFIFACLFRFASRVDFLVFGCSLFLFVRLCVTKRGGLWYRMQEKKHHIHQQRK